MTFRVGRLRDRLWPRHATVACRGRQYAIWPGVFHPARHLSGMAFASVLDELIEPEMRVLDLGTGCGLLAGVAAERAASVVACDIDPVAVDCARHNLGDLHHVEVRRADLFEAVAGEHFDLVITNPPYEIGATDDLTLGSPDFLARFGREVGQVADRVALGYPAEDAALLAVTGLDLTLWRRVPTRGRPLGIFVAEARGPGATMTDGS